MELSNILKIGFNENKDWFFETTGTKNYILKNLNKTYRAIYTENNGTPYFQIGVCVDEKGIVDRWRDVCSIEHLNKLIKVA